MLTANWTLKYLFNHKKENELTIHIARPFVDIQGVTRQAGAEVGPRHVCTGLATGSQTTFKAFINIWNVVFEQIRTIQLETAAQGKQKENPSQRKLGTKYHIKRGKEGDCIALCIAFKIISFACHHTHRTVIFIVLRDYPEKLPFYPLSGHSTQMVSNCSNRENRLVSYSISAIYIIICCANALCSCFPLSLSLHPQ